MRQCLFITLPDGRNGFGLAGFSQMVIEQGQLEASIQQGMENKAVGMIVIDERLLGGIDEDRLQAIEKRWDGIIVILPRPASAADRGEDFALRLIRRAVGYQVRLTP
jgi:vacuolar-type H+-ATPase subunit F/Vma7